MNTVTWGIISTAKIGINQVIPAIQQAGNCTVKGIASRTKAKARKAADKLGVADAHGSYKGLFEDPSIDAVYNPLPNHMHVSTTIDALKAGKHVLCEKPISLDADEAQKLIDATKKYPDLKVMEAFMYRFHPQWIRAKSMVDDEKIGKLQTIESFFSYYNNDPDDIRNKADMGGGGLMDIGCYCISLSRFLFGREPVDVLGRWKIDSEFNTDYLASGILDFDSGTSTFTCSTQTAPNQRVNIVGTKGRIVIDIPFNAPTDKTTRMWFYRDGKKEEIEFPVVNQYTLQAREFANAILNDQPVPTPLKDALNNMKVIDAFRKSCQEPMHENRVNTT